MAELQQAAKMAAVLLSAVLQAFKALSNALHMHAVLQVVFEPQTQPEASKLGARLRSEWVVCVKGQLRLRKDPNPKMPTGEQQQQQQQQL